MRLYREYIFDLDGTLYRGDEAVPHAVDVVSELRRRGALIRFITNNSSQTQDFYKAKLTRLGFEAEIGEIYSSATGTASHLKSEKCKSVFVLGMPGLGETLKDAGLQVVEEGDQADAVAVGICLTLTYKWLNAAMQQILGGAKFVATNPDKTFPIEGGKLTPGAGSIVAAVQACSGVEPFVVGKPNPFLLRLALQESEVPAKEALAVGDRLDTDIESGRAAGCDTHLVLTGVEKSAPAGQPFSPDLRGLLE